MMQMSGRFARHWHPHSRKSFHRSARGDGENDFASRNIRNSISLTMRRAGRMICASHQRGA
jgi:hypothetical protein